MSGAPIVDDEGNVVAIMTIGIGESGNLGVGIVSKKIISYHLKAIGR